MRYECEVRRETCTVPVGKEIPSGRTRVRAGDMLVRPQGAGAVEAGSTALSGCEAKRAHLLSDW